MLVRGARTDYRSPEQFQQNWTQVLRLELG